MGQKVHPTGIRLGIVKKHSSTWYAGNKDYAEKLNQDLAVRGYIRKKLAHASVSRIDIERPSDSARVTIHTARPGIIIGKKGMEIDKLKIELQTVMGGKQVNLNIKEVRRAELDAVLIGQTIALQLEKRVSFRRAMKKSVVSALRFGAKGIKIRVSGRLGGAEIARSEWYREGRVPLHTLRADIDYGTANSNTTYGIIGVKVWVYKGDFVPSKGIQRPQGFQEKDKDEKGRGRGKTSS